MNTKRIELSQMCNVEDITWPRGDTKILLSFCKMFPSFAQFYLLDLIHIDEIPNCVEKLISFSRVEKYFTP